MCRVARATIPYTSTPRKITTPTGKVINQSVASTRCRTPRPVLPSSGRPRRVTGRTPACREPSERSRILRGAASEGRLWSRSGTELVQFLSTCAARSPGARGRHGAAWGEGARPRYADRRGQDLRPPFTNRRRTVAGRGLGEVQRSALLGRPSSLSPIPVNHCIGFASLQVRPNAGCPHGLPLRRSSA